ncbi:hypothetical protein WL88_25775 [Burkholderia diffusa]|uniref:Uncharacterized protein n=1 Tax=Burkholderia diffusa TaxID=488732 RepID=A0AAW3PC51_9BURK|nr:hypothetical protein WL86_29805 [Burkholderia diffusa]KWF38679.1 hypothetical protein WL85_10960 [Burkholderia diffusa]KWF46724.1 hypothetical protein WL88_25775 [Burkholderia diffusa]KWF50704.1 hypothetical protein WL87_16145 [Burkholderia diffusa]
MANTLGIVVGAQFYDRIDHFRSRDASRVRPRRNDHCTVWNFLVRQVNHLVIDVQTNSRSTENKLDTKFVFELRSLGKRLRQQVFFAKVLFGQWRTIIGKMALGT